MSVRLKVPTQLRELTGGAPELDVEASSIKELLEKVGGDHPELLERVLDEGGEIRRFVNLYVGDEDVRFLEGIDTPLKDGEVVVLLPAVAGGRGSGSDRHGRQGLLDGALGRRTEPPRLDGAAGAHHEGRRGEAHVVLGGELGALLD